jgi:hypothetical protein
MPSLFFTVVAAIVVFLGFGPAVTIILLGVSLGTTVLYHCMALRRCREGNMLLRADNRRRQADASKLISDRLVLQFTEGNAQVLYIGKVNSGYEYVRDGATSGDRAGHRRVSRLIAY